MKVHLKQRTSAYQMMKESVRPLVIYQKLGSKFPKLTTFSEKEQTSQKDGFRIWKTAEIRNKEVKREKEKIKEVLWQSFIR